MGLTMIKKLLPKIFGIGFASVFVACLIAFILFIFFGAIYLPGQMIYDKFFNSEKIALQKTYDKMAELTKYKASPWIHDKAGDLESMCYRFMSKLEKIKLDEKHGRIQVWTDIFKKGEIAKKLANDLIGEFKYLEEKYGKDAMSKFVQSYYSIDCEDHRAFVSAPKNPDPKQVGRDLEFSLGKRLLQ
jgi:hypothetical protein